MKMGLGPGRPRRRWMDRVMSDLAEVSRGTRLEDGEDRIKRRGVVDAAKVLRGL